MARKKPLAPTERSDEDKYSTADKDLFIDTWLDYANEVDQEDWTRDGWTAKLRAAFDPLNPKSKRTDDQIASSLFEKAKVLRKSLLEQGDGCPPIPEASTRQSIKDVGRKHRERLNAWK